MINNTFSELFKKLKIKPKCYSFYMEAMTHISFSNDNHLSYNYERLELLGDTIISLVVVQYLFDKIPKMSVGDITKTKIMIVQSKSEIMAAKQLNLKEYILLGNSIAHDKNHEKIFEDVYESLIGAIFLDLGLEVARRVVIETLCIPYEKSKLNSLVDFKSKFQELMMKYGKKSIKYKVFKNAHDNYHAELWCNNIKYGTGIGKKIKEAEQLAAKEACNKFTGGR